MPGDKKIYQRNGLNIDPRAEAQLANVTLWDDYGMRLIFNNDTSLYINSGCRIVKNTIARISSPLFIDKSNLISGTNFISEKWYYVYISSTNVAYIDSLAPTKDYNNITILPNDSIQRYHPTLQYRFIGSFKTTASSKIINFEIINDLVLFKSGKNLLMINGKTTTRKILDCSYFVPETSKVIYTYYESTVTGTKNIGASTINYAMHNASGSGTCCIPTSDRGVYYETANKDLSIGVLGYVEKI